MSADQTFTFDLNESLYFEKGQEVQEMLHISLDPEISIQPFNDYVSIRGVIELEGKYQKIQEGENDDGLTVDEDHSMVRHIESVYEDEDGISSFTHRFPVEISVPSYRVQSVDDITVSIDSFDYEIPQENKLTLTSVVKIDGISESEHFREEDDKEVEDPAYDTFRFDEKNELETTEKENDEAEEVETEELSNIPSINIERSEAETQAEPSELSDTAELDSVKKEEDEEKERWFKKKAQSFDEFFKESEKESETATEEKKLDETFEKEQQHSDTVTQVDEMDDELEHMSQEIHDVQEENVEEEDNISTEIVEEDISYLSDMFRTDEIDEEYTQMRICIVQERDTIESIAERYEIPESQLLKLNSLEDEDLEEGQLLSIPRKKVK